MFTQSSNLCDNFLSSGWRNPELESTLICSRGDLPRPAKAFLLWTTDYESNSDADKTSVSGA